jgi:hypothetical protein
MREKRGGGVKREREKEKEGEGEREPASTDNEGGI